MTTRPLWAGWSMVASTVSRVWRSSALAPVSAQPAGRPWTVHTRCKRQATWAGQIVSALERQSVVVAGTDAAAVVLPHLASQLIALHAQRADVAAQVEALVQAHPRYQVPTSMPGIGVRTAAIFLAETLGKDPDTGALLASYAGLAPVTRRSGSSIRGEHVSHGGNKRLKRAIFLSAFASLAPTPSPGPTTSANATKINAITRPFSPWPTAA